MSLCGRQGGFGKDTPAVLWAAKRAYENSPNEYLFPRYCSEKGCKVDYASNSLNKWLRQHVQNGCVVHSFRHSMRDRLRAVECPSEIIDQKGFYKMNRKHFGTSLN